MGSGAFARRGRRARRPAAFGPCLLTAPADYAAGRRPRRGAERGGRGRRTSPVATAPPACRSRAWPAATRARSACTPAASASWSRAGPRTSPPAPAGAAPLAVVGAVVVGGGVPRRRAAGVAAGTSVGRRPGDAAVARAGAGLPWPPVRWCCGRIGPFRWWTAWSSSRAARWPSSRCSPARSWLTVLRRPRRAGGAGAIADRRRRPGERAAVAPCPDPRATWPSTSWPGRLVHAGTGYAVHRLPLRRLGTTPGCTAAGASNGTGAFYRAARHPPLEGPAARGRRAVRRRHVASGACRRRTRRPRPLRRRDPPGRARALAGGGGRAAVRAVEPAGRSRW